MTGDPLIDQTYAGLLESFAAPVVTPGGVSAAALAAAMAAALVERCAAKDPAVRSRAVLLRAELIAVAEDDIPVLQALATTAPADRGTAAAAASRPAAALATPPARSPAWRGRWSAPARGGCRARRCAPPCWPRRPPPRPSR